MITCSKCQSTLPDWATTCQFCGADVTQIARPAPSPSQKKAYAYGPAPWVWVTYYLIAGWWVLSGGFSVVREAMGSDPSSPMAIVRYLFSGILVLFGFGLIFRIEFFRGVAHFIAWVNIFFGVLGLLAAFGMMLLFPVMGVLMLVDGLLNIVSSGLLIYLIGETSGFAPS